MTKASDKRNINIMGSRQNILSATKLLLQTHGLACLTMRSVARKANVAEGLIYHHFKDKAELIFEVIETRVRNTKSLMQNLPLQVGQRSVEENLEDILTEVYHAHYSITPIICSVFADQKLHARTQEIINEREGGPQRAIEGLGVYLAAEQRLGRVSDNIDPAVTAKCLWLISIQLAMLNQLIGYQPDAAHVRHEIGNYLKTFMTGLKPNPPKEKK